MSREIEIKKTDFERDQDKKYELDEVQEHFRTSNEMLIDGIPWSKWQKLQEIKKRGENEKTI